MLKEKLIDKVRVVEKVETWKDAIRLAAEPLLEAKSINETYIEAMIENVKKFGTYMVIAPKIAMPHSRPEDGVNENCIALLKVNESFMFGYEDDEENKVNLLFVIGAVDNNSHINTLTELMDIVDDEDKVEEIIKADTVEKIMELI